MANSFNTNGFLEKRVHNSSNKAKSLLQSYVGSSDFIMYTHVTYNVSKTYIVV